MRTTLRFPCKNRTHPTYGGGGVGITPLPFFLSKGGHPPPHLSGQVGGTSSQYCKKIVLKLRIRKYLYL